MQNLTGPTSPICAITFCNDVVYACILVKILHMVTDFRLTCRHGGKTSTFVSGSDFSLGKLTFLMKSHLFLFPFRSLRIGRAQSIANQKDKECCGSFFIVLFPDQSVPRVLEEHACSVPYVCVCLVQILKHTWSSNSPSHSISGKEVGKDIIHVEE